MAMRRYTSPPMRYRNPIPLLRTLALIEGLSFLVLLFVAMPLKYLADAPAAVTGVGWAHGVLFVALVGVLAWTMVVARWPIGRGVLVLMAALLPFGPFVLDPRMRQYAAEFDRGRTAT